MFEKCHFHLVQALLQFFIVSLFTTLRCYTVSVASFISRGSHWNVPLACNKISNERVSSLWYALTLIRKKSLRCNVKSSLIKKVPVACKMWPYASNLELNVFFCTFRRFVWREADKSDTLDLCLTYRCNWLRWWSFFFPPQESNNEKKFLMWPQMVC